MGKGFILKVGLGILVILVVIAQFILFPKSQHYSAVPNPISIRSSSKSTLNSTTHVETSIVTRWILTLWSFVVSDGRSVFESKERTDIALLIRRLVVFSVREINNRLNGTLCSTWWVNPLSVSQFEEEQTSPGTTHYNLTFEVHPGGIPFRSFVALRQEFPVETKPFAFNTLVFLNATRLDKTSSRKYSNFSHNPEVSNICLCPEEKVSAEEFTIVARTKWAQSDVELFSWPPNVSMSVADYIRFHTMDLYLKSPSNKTDFCGPEVKMLLFISSAPAHFQQRENIRNTFGNFSFLESNGVKMVFLFGNLIDSEMQAKINAEFVKFNDIVQANFVDSYHNLTLSHLSMYNWVVTHCRTQGSPMPRWLLKADDDFFLNLPLARRIADANAEIELIGISFCGTLAIRNVDYMTKYYVPRYMYAPDYYAGYVSGVAYIVRTDVLEPMLHASLTTPIIHMDDAYVMGLLTRELGIYPRDAPLITYEKAASQCDIITEMSSYVNGEMTLESMWAIFHNSSNLCKVDEGKLKVNQLTETTSRFCLYS